MMFFTTTGQASERYGYSYVYQKDTGEILLYIVDPDQSPQMIPLAIHDVGRLARFEPSPNGLYAILIFAAPEGVSGVRYVLLDMTTYEEQLIDSYTRSEIVIGIAEFVDNHYLSQIIPSGWSPNSQYYTFLSLGQNLQSAEEDSQLELNIYGLTEREIIYSNQLLQYPTQVVWSQDGNQFAQIDTNCSNNLGTCDTNSFYIFDFPTGTPVSSMVFQLMDGGGGMNSCRASFSPNKRYLSFEAHCYDIVLPHEVFVWDTAYSAEIIPNLPPLTTWAMGVAPEVEQAVLPHFEYGTFWLDAEHLIVGERIDPYNLQDKIGTMEQFFRDDTRIYDVTNRGYEVLSEDFLSDWLPNPTSNRIAYYRSPSVVEFTTDENGRKTPVIIGWVEIGSFQKHTLTTLQVLTAGKILSWSPDGNQLAYLNEDQNQIIFFNMNTNELRQLDLPFTYDAYAISSDWQLGGWVIYP